MLKIFYALKKATCKKKSHFERDSQRKNAPLMKTRKRERGGEKGRRSERKKAEKGGEKREKKVFYLYAWCARHCSRFEFIWQWHC